MSDIIDDKVNKALFASRQDCEICGHSKSSHSSGACKNCSCHGTFQ